MSRRKDPQDFEGIRDPSRLPYVRINPVKSHATSLIRSITHLASCMHTSLSLPLSLNNLRVYRRCKYQPAGLRPGLRFRFTDASFLRPPDGRKYEVDCYWRISIPFSPLQPPHSPVSVSLSSFTLPTHLSFLTRSPFYSALRLRSSVSVTEFTFLPLSFSVPAIGLAPSHGLCSQFKGIGGSVTVPLEGLSVYQDDTRFGAAESANAGSRIIRNCRGYFYKNFTRISSR